MFPLYGNTRYSVLNERRGPIQISTSTDPTSNHVIPIYLLLQVELNACGALLRLIQRSFFLSHCERFTPIRPRPIKMLMHYDLVKKIKERKSLIISESFRVLKQIKSQSNTVNLSKSEKNSKTW